MSRDDQISQVKQTLALIPPEMASVRTSTDQYEYRFEVVPKTNKHCSFWLAFSTYNTYGLCFGHGLCFEDISISEFRPAEVIDAILKGNVYETVWSRNGKVIKSKGRIVLSDGRELADTAILRCFGLELLGKQEQIRYQAYL